MPRLKHNYLPTPLGALLALLLSVSCVLAQDSCIDYADFPNLEANVSILGEARGMDVQGDFLFVAAYLKGLEVVDISDPAAPRRIAGLDTPGQALAVDCVGDLVYLADGAEGFRIISVATPQTPSLVGAINTLGYVRNLEVAGNYAYMAVDWASGGLMIMDVSDPANPVEVSVTATAGTARDVVVNGHHAYVSDNDGNLYVFDVTDPAAPALAYTIPVGGTASAMGMSGSLLAVADPGLGLHLFDLTDPASPAPAGFYTLKFDLNDVFLDGTTGYVLNYTQVIVLDLGDPTNPRELTALRLSDGPDAVIVEGSLVFASMGSAGVQVIQDNGFDLPLAVGSLAPANNFSPGPFDMYNGAAFVASDQLYSVVVINPANPVLAGTATVGNTNLDIDIQGPFAYIITDTNVKIHVFNVTNPTTPFRVHDFIMGGNRPDNLLAYGNYLYSGQTSNGLGIADITDPAEAFRLDHEGLGGTNNCMAVRGDSLFIGRVHEVEIVDISSRTNPVSAGSISSTGQIWGVTLQGRYVYIAAPYHGLYIVDLEQSGTPIVGHFPGWLFNHITVHDGIAYVSSLRMGLYVFDVSDVTQPQLLGIKRGGCVKSMVEGDHLVVSGSGYMGGIEVLPLQCNPLSSVDDRPQPAPGLQLSAYPNPFNPQTVFSFSLEGAQVVEMTVHDLNGRLVRRLVRGQNYSAGNHTIRWDGRDDQGRRLASGKYFGRLLANGQQSTHPVVLLK